MEMENKIIGMLETITERLGNMDKRMDGFDQKFDRMDKRMGGFDQKFDRIDKRMDGFDQKFDRMDKRVDGIEQKLELQSETLKEHGQILRALKTGQEYLKAEIDGMKIANAKEFGLLKEEMQDHTVKLELVREDTWANKVDIHRVKTTMGLK